MTAIAIVTGGAGGLGRLLTLELARAGSHVVVADRDEAAGKEVVDAVAAAGGRATFVETDASEAAQVHRLVDRAGSLGKVAVLVNNAGGWLPGPQFPDTDEWRRALDLNLAMPMLATQLCVPLMSAAGGGAVVNVSSSGGWDSGAYGSPEYAAAKAGMVRFTTAVRDFAPRFGVRVSCVVPHWIGLERAIEQYEQLDAEERLASGGLVDPATVVRAVVDLTQDPDSAGRVVVVRPGRDPYPVDPASYDPAGP
jgi:3-oxoacyl-[acyl-carrier protein] reductase